MFLDDDAERIRTCPLLRKHLDRWRASRPQTPSSSQIPHRPLIPNPISQPEETEQSTDRGNDERLSSLEQSALVIAGASSGDTGS